MTAAQTAYRKSLLRKYHWVCSELGLSKEEKDAIKEGLGVKSSRNFSIDQLKQLIDRLQSGKDYSQSYDPEGDLWRKRVIAAIGAWLRIANRTETPEVIKAIACRATRYENFNKIPVSRLRDIYYGFSRKAKTTKGTLEVMDDIVSQLETMN